MKTLRETAELEIAAPPETVWAAIIDPELTSRYYFGCRIESDWRPGGPYAYQHPNGNPAEAGIVLEFEPPRRLVLEARLLYSPAVGEDPPHLVTWELEPAPQGRTRVRLTRAFDTETRSYRSALDSSAMTLRGLAVVTDPEVQAAIRRKDVIGDVVIRDLTPERVADYQEFFDGPAFTAYPAWSFCYCLEPHWGGSDEDLNDLRTSQRRDRMSDMVRHGDVRAVMAYVDGRPAAWCNAGPTTALDGIRRHFYPDSAPESKVGSIGCFVISSPYRGHGLAKRLLDAACERLRREGAEVVEAYPRKEGDDDRSFRGPLLMYVDAGFEVVRETGHTAVVRKRLRG